MFDSFFNPKVPFVAIDLSDRSVKIARAEQGRLFGIARADLPDGLVFQGRVQDSDGLAKALSNLLHAGPARKLFAKAAAMTLPEEQCFIRIIRVPVLSAGELEQAIHWEADAAIPLPQGEAVVSWQVIGPTTNGEQLEVLVSGAPRDLAESYADMLRRVPLTPVVFEPESFAIARALLRQEDRDAVLILDLGREHSGVIITHDRVVRVTANIPIAARLFTERISAVKKLSLKQAEELKRKDGIGTEREGPAIRAILEPVLAELTEQIRQFFTFFETHENVQKGQAPAGGKTGELSAGGTIARVLLTGGDALMKGLPEYLAQALRVPVNIGDPFRNYAKIPKRTERHPLYTTVAGLARYTIDISSL